MEYDKIYSEEIKVKVVGFQYNKKNASLCLYTFAKFVKLPVKNYELVSLIYDES